ncbi:hypothetical protein L2E82_15103 [Cichorium intybus]|uniref:Uncharacterized protein n=1 Tax=Cichorium intybus TaxID=13427 RepID=A0ACB9F1V8_CICIN|nr:hypothetical protein L2E82_15103 [Cichorium intybus]
MKGEGEGEGYNINVLWENGKCGDADYIAVWDHILIPVAREFKPDIILISAGFDTALGDPLGGCRITPHGYSVMLKKIAIALEGGYNLTSIENSILACVEVLLQDKLIVEPHEIYRFESTWKVIKVICSSQSEDEYDDGPNTVSEDLHDDDDDDDDDVTIPLSKLKVSDDAHGKFCSDRDT